MFLDGKVSRNHECVSLLLFLKLTKNNFAISSSLCPMAQSKIKKNPGTPDSRLTHKVHQETDALAVSRNCHSAQVHLQEPLRTVHHLAHCVHERYPA